MHGAVVDAHDGLGAVAPEVTGRDVIAFLVRQNSILRLVTPMVPLCMGVRTWISLSG